MARRPRAPSADGTRVPFKLNPRRFLLVDRTNFEDYQKRWREIDRTWPPFDMENVALIAGLRQNARELLRSEIRRATNVGPAEYIIAV